MPKENHPRSVISIMLIRFFSLAITLLSVHAVYAQQFLGLTPNKYAAIQQIPYNPAWVNNSDNGTEIHFLSVSALAGTNAMSLPLNGGEAYKDRSRSKKMIWENLDILGPAISFKYKDKHHFAVTTRMRQLVRGGNMPSDLFNILGEEKIDSAAYLRPFTINDMGVTLNAFGEVGVSYGRILMNDEYHILKGGASLKYIMGFAGASLYVDNTDLSLKDGDTISQVKGEVNMLYTYNMNAYAGNNPGGNALAFMERAGTSGLGFDIGAQYEYHPDGTPNYETPYKYSIAVSITDIGYVNYYADSGSGSYNLVANGKNYNTVSKPKGEELAPFLQRLVADTFITRTSSRNKFSMGLPTALRINTEWVANEKFSVSANVLLNLKSNADNIYKPSYMSYINVSPNYGNRKISVSLPCTYYGRHTLTFGAVFRAGPFYIGSSSLLSNAMAKSLRNADFYFGFMMKLRKDKFII